MTNYLSFEDTVLSLQSQRITKKASPYRGSKAWIVKCKEHTFKVIETLLESKEFLTEVENNSAIGKTYTFKIQIKGKYLIKVN